MEWREPSSAHFASSVWACALQTSLLLATPVVHYLVMMQYCIWSDKICQGSPIGKWVKKRIYLFKVCDTLSAANIRGKPSVHVRVMGRAAIEIHNRHMYRCAVSIGHQSGWQPTRCRCGSPRNKTRGTAPENISQFSRRNVFQADFLREAIARVHVITHPEYYK